jgi:hypothetical protein
MKMTRREALQSAAVAALETPAAPRHIKTVDIIHHSHQDVGYTDLPSVCRDQQVRFLDAALEACLRNPAFRWTIESLVVLEDFRRRVPKPRMDALLKVIRKGQMDVAALPFNQAPFMDEREWRQALNWIPESLWQEVKPQIAIQSDVNGFPRAGVKLLLDRGVKRLLMGINADSGGPPARRPSAFWWKQPDGRRMFVWMGDHYGSAYSYFEAKGWQHGQPKGGDTTLRPPRAGEILRTDEASLKAAQQQLLKRLEKLESEGYDYPRLLVSFTNQWRYDNDAPFPPLAPFVEAWNRLGLQPGLRLVTASEGVAAMEQAAGAKIPSLEGEWPDWWANGDASAPREVAASRLAKRFIAACDSPVWKAPAGVVEQRTEPMLRDLCLFDEHTWGANVSVSAPWSLDTQGQFTEKAILAYRPMGNAEWLLGRLARTRMMKEPAGTYVANAAPAAYSGWAGQPPVWVEKLAPNSVVRLEPFRAESDSKPMVLLDSSGWPVHAAWPGMKKPLFGAGLADVLGVMVQPPANRGTIAKMHSTKDTSARKDVFKNVPATYGAAKYEENPHTMVFEQTLEHPRLERGQRRVEIFRREPRARVTVRFDRVASTAPELFYIGFSFPTESVLPRLSNGGMPFTPYVDQIPGSCADYYAIDGWAHYRAADGEWLWVTRDAPLVAVGGPHPVERRTAKPDDPQRLYAMVFDNCWHTNFVADQHGTFEFRFELAWNSGPMAVAETAAAMASEPVVVVNPAEAESPELAEYLFKP